MMSQDSPFQDDHRIFERFAAVIPVNMFDVDAGTELNVLTRDVSAKGIGVICEERLNPGNRLELRLKINDGKEPLYAKGDVIWSSPQESGGYRAGISLEKTELMGMARILRS